MAIIEVEHVTKEYRLGAMQSIKTIAGRMIGRMPPDSSNFKALDDVNFSIEKGEVVGIIGHNGAGKSTLLKLLSRISTPTTGRITVRGKIAPLIEVGAGLVGEMTGRENIYLNASILGMSRSSIESKIGEIIEFSELTQFIDTPVKRYSSGMQVRLGFAIATVADAEILIVDEVLAVGDLNFQRKCLERMDTIIKSEEKTVIIVGHNIRQLERVCTRMILMEHGRIFLDGNAADVANKYYELNERQRATAGVSASSSVTDGGVTLENFQLFDIPNAKQIDQIDIHEPLKFRVTVNSSLDYPDVDVAIGFHTVDFLHVITFNTRPVSFMVDLNIGLTTIECSVKDVPLMPGLYGVRLGISDKYGRTIWYKENIKTILVSPGNFSRSQMSLQSFIDLPVEWCLPD